MFRKIALGLIAAVSLSAGALVSGAAFAHGMHGGGHGGGWHGGWGHGFRGSSAFYVGGISDDCLQQQWVETRRGLRLRTVDVCGY